MNSLGHEGLMLKLRKVNIELTRCFSGRVKLLRGFCCFIDPNFEKSCVRLKYTVCVLGVVCVCM